jgi:hypothetical protein
MAFSREDLKKYESQTQTQVSDKVNPFRGATPAAAASPAAVAAVAAGHIDAHPGGVAVAAAAKPDPLTDDAPVVDEDGTLGDPTDSGEGTSDVNTEDSSASAVDSGDEAGPNTDLVATADEDADDATPPKKGSARERIVELADLTEGYKVFGKQMQEQLLAANAEIARLRGGPAAPAAPPVVEIKDEPMPDMSDEDIGFDNDKYRVKMKNWVKNQVKSGVVLGIREMTGADAASKMRQDVEAKVETFAKDHPDFKEKVSENAVLAQHQLAPDAGYAVAQSEYTAELLYKFGTDTALAIRIAKQSPAQQLLTIGRLIGDIEREKASKVASKGSGNPQPGAKPGAKKSITQAPPPPRATPASGRPVTRDSLDPAMDMNEFARQHRSGKQSAREANRKGRGLN